MHVIPALLPCQHPHTLTPWTRLRLYVRIKHLQCQDCISIIMEDDITEKDKNLLTYLDDPS